MTTLLEALARRVEELACHDASCAPPPVGTGGSKKGGPSRGSVSPSETARVKPVPAFHSMKQAYDLFGDDRGLRARISEGFTGDLGGGFESAVEKITSNMSIGEIYVRGGIYHPDHGRVGSFVRKLLVEKVGGTSMNPEGEILARHDYLDVDPQYQGRGIAQKFNDRALQMYEELGVDRIELSASLDFGPFAWARQGYRYDETAGSMTRSEWVTEQMPGLRSEIKRRESSGEVSKDAADAMRSTITELNNASKKGADVQPYHLASLGEGDPAWTTRDGQSWLGKDHLVSWEGSQTRREQHWPGVYYLGRESVLASAFERRMEELACHDASCAPPPIGTGGSKPSGGSGVAFSTGATSARKRELMELAGDARLAAAEAKKVVAAASDAYYQGYRTNEALETMYRAEDEYKRLVWAAEKADFARIESRTVEAEISVKVGRKTKTFKVYKDDSVAWDDELVEAAVNQYTKLVKEFDVEPVTLAFGPASTTRAILEHPDIATQWADGKATVMGIRTQMDRWQDSNGYLLGDLGNATSPTPWALGVTEKTASMKPGTWNPKGFNRNVTETLDAAGRAEYVTTHEFGHLLYFSHIKETRGLDERALLMDSGMGTEWGMGHTTEGLRLPSLGTYAYSSAREFAAETFAVDYHGWDDDSGVPLEMMLGWAYERRY